MSIALAKQEAACLQQGTVVSIAGSAYTIGARIGSGSFSVVYEASTPGGHVVAIKCMKYVTWIAADTNRQEAAIWLENEIEELLEEVKRQSCAAAVGVAPVVYGVDATQGLLAMELIPADRYETIYTIIHRTGGSLPAWQQLKLLRALAALRKNNISYRDSNLYNNVLFPVSPDDDAKVLDYGDVGHASHNVWATLYSFCVDRNSCKTLNHIAGLIRDHADWFELPTRLRRKQGEKWSDFVPSVEVLEACYGWSFSYNSAFEHEARDILHWSLLPNTPSSSTSGTDASAITNGSAEVPTGNVEMESSTGTEPPNVKNLQPGQTIVVAHVCYSIVAKLGAGCWAVVYEAVSSGGTRVAIKCMKPGVCAGKTINIDSKFDLAAFTAEFEREVALQRRAAALGVAPAVIDVDASNRVIVMEFLHKSEYTLMSDMLPCTEAALSESQQLGLLKGLAKLKTAGITCRDTNFLLNVFFPIDPMGYVKIIDYGSFGRWNDKENVWITLFYYLTEHRGLFQLNHIAGVIRDHPLLFDICKPYLARSAEEALQWYNLALTRVKESNGISFDYTAGFETEVRRILQTCNNPVHTVYTTPDTIGMEHADVRVPITVTRCGRRVFAPVSHHLITATNPRVAMKKQTETTSRQVSGVKRICHPDPTGRMAKRARVHDKGATGGRI
jgi:serine/threonine protein kinase